MYKIYRLAPYFILIILGVLFVILYSLTKTEYLKIVFINLASSSFFVVIAYLFYDLIKTRIEKQEYKSIDIYIRNLIGNDVFVVLYTLKKYLHGYNLETNQKQYILNINEYSKEQIETLVKHQSYIGFQIFKEMSDIKELFSSALDNNLFIKYGSREYVMNLLKIVNLIMCIEYIFRNPANYIESPEKAIEYICVNGKDLNPQNDENRYLLLKKTQIDNRYVVYDSGTFDNSDKEKLLNRYILKPDISKMLADNIYRLNNALIFWLPDDYQITKYDKSYKIIKDYFCSFTRAFTKKSKIFTGDIVETNKNVVDK